MTPGPRDAGRGAKRPARTLDPAPELVVVGRMGKPHGVRGEVCVHSHAQDPALFDSLGRVYLLPPNQPAAKPVRTLAIQSWRPQGKHLVVRFQGIDDRDQAASLTNLDLAVAEADLPEPDPDEVYLHEIMGFQVVDTQGADLGRLERFMDSAGQNSGHEVWVIIHPTGKEIMLPAVEQVVLDIDPDRELITVDPPPGLVELYLDEEPAKPKRDEK